jgi:hypothetical protein
MCNGLVAFAMARSLPLPPATGFPSETSFVLTSVAADLGGEAATRAAAMPDAFFHEFTTFALGVIAIAAAILLIAGCHWLLRRSGWSGALDLAGILERWIGPMRKPEATVNVEYRDAAGVLMDLGPYIHAVLRNGRGKSFALSEGVFVDCEPTWIKPGALAHVSVQDGLVREELVVQVDMQREMLFVKSRLRLADLVTRINSAHRDEAAE